MTYVPVSLPASGATQANLISGGVNGALERLIALIQANTPTAAPTAAPTLSASGSGGALAAGSWFGCFTETNTIGETTASPVSAVQAVTAGQDLIFTFPALQTGNTARNAYVAQASAGPFQLVATGITAGTATIAVVPAAGAGGSFAVGPPSTNSTGLSALKISALRSAEKGNLQMVFRLFCQLVDNWISGNATTFNEFNIKLRDVSIAFHALAQITDEIGAVVDANPGTIALGKPNLITAQTMIRTWP
jgi:hypothetical protein